MLPVLKRSLSLNKSINSIFLNQFSTYNKINTSVPNSRPFHNQEKHIDFSFEEKYLRSAFPQVRDTLLEEGLRDFQHHEEFSNRFKHLIDYCVNLPTYALATALLSVRAYRYLEKPSLITEEKLMKAAILGWSFRVCETSSILLDDIDDQGEIRYGKPTWYKKVGPSETVYDSDFLHSGIVFLLLKYFSDHPQMVNIVRDSVRNFCSVQMSQLIQSRRYKLEDLEKNVNYVKAYPFAVYVFSAALYNVNITDPKIHLSVRDFTTKLVEYLQVQDDVKCITLTVEDTGKICTDILMGRPSWLTIQAYKRGNASQRARLQNLFNKNSPEAAAEAKTLFAELNMKKAFKEFEEDYYNLMLEKIERLPKQLPKQLFLDALNFSLTTQFIS